VIDDVATEHRPKRRADHHDHAREGCGFLPEQNRISTL